MATKRKLSDEQIIAVIKQLEAGRSAVEMAGSWREHIYDLRMKGEVWRHGAE